MNRTPAAIDCNQCQFRASQHCRDCLITHVQGNQLQPEDATLTLLGAAGLVPPLRFEPAPVPVIVGRPRRCNRHRAA